MGQYALLFVAISYILVPAVVFVGAEPAANEQHERLRRNTVIASPLVLLAAAMIIFTTLLFILIDVATGLAMASDWMEFGRKIFARWVLRY